MAWGAAGTYRRPWSRASALRRRSHGHYRGSRARCDCGRRSTTAISPSSRSFQCGARSRRCAASPEGARLVGRCGGACARGVDVDAKSRARGLQQLDCGARPRCELSLPTGNSFSGLRALPQRRVGAGAKNTWAQCDRCRRWRLLTEVTSGLASEMPSIVRPILTRVRRLPMTVPLRRRKRRTTTMSMRDEADGH